MHGETVKLKKKLQMSACMDAPLKIYALQ